MLPSDCCCQAGILPDSPAPAVWGQDDDIFHNQIYFFSVSIDIFLTSANALLADAGSFIMALSLFGSGRSRP